MILQNGKRIDGCSDTVPVGTLQPYLGLVPPKGYLVCQGQLVSKITYSKLYEICGDTFGASTETHFYLPDLRGKTLAGYDENDTTMNTIGKLLGQKTHTHTSAAHTHTIAGHTHTSAAHTHSTGNHTLTIAEVPAHNHQIYDQNRSTALATGSTEGTENAKMINGLPNSAYALGNDHILMARSDGSGGNGAHNHGNTGSTTPGNTGSTSLTTDSTTPGATGSNTNYQPTITVNWIVKAVMLIPDYIIVEDTLNSDSVVDALSARQGKILNEKFADYATKSEMIQYLPLSGGTMTGELKIGQADGYGIQLGTNGHINATINGNPNATILGMLYNRVTVGFDQAPLYIRGSHTMPYYNDVLLIETGSNSNGDYIKFADGTLICKQKIAVNNVSADISWGSIYAHSNTDDYTFPHTFISEPILSISTGTCGASMGYWLGDYGNRYVSNTGWRGWCLMRPNSASITTTLHVLAIGRWK